jgi:hypothetical protein
MRWCCAHCLLPSLGPTLLGVWRETLLAYLRIKLDVATRQMINQEEWISADGTLPVGECVSQPYTQLVAVLDVFRRLF